MRNNFLQRAACHQFAAKYGSQYCFHFCKNLQIGAMLYGVLEGNHINLTNLYFRFTLPPQKNEYFASILKNIITFA